MENKIIIGVDHGNRFIKSLEGIYSSGYVESLTVPPVTENLLYYNGKYYSIGGNRVKYRYDKTIDETFFILTLPALAMRLNKEGLTSADAILGVGLPLSHFQLKQKFINYLKRENVDFDYNQKKYQINIKDVMCFPQAISGYMLHFEKYRGIDYLNLLDFGQVTLDAVKIHQGKPIINSAISLNWGMIKLVKKIQEQIRKETGIEISEEQIEMTLQGKKALFFDDRIDKIIMTTTIAFVNEMLDELRENGYELQATMNLLMGGGAYIVQKTLDLGQHQNRIGYTEILAESQIANALGYERLIKEALRRR
jgi:plasmid segregation protein ParM